MVLWSFKGTIAKLGKTKPKVQPVPNKLLNPGMPPRNESSSPWPLLVYLWTHILMQKRSHNRWASLRKLHRHLCEEIQAEQNGYQVQSSDPNCTWKPFGGKNPLMQAGKLVEKTIFFTTIPSIQAFRHISKNRNMRPMFWWPQVLIFTIELYE